MNGLQDRVALVTGGTGLIGGAVVRRLTTEGVQVVVTSRNLEKARGWINEQEQAERMLPLPLDLADTDSIDQTLDAAVSQVGLPTILIANASLREGLATPFDQIGHEQFTQLYNVDVAGHFQLARRLVEQLNGNDKVSIVLLSSIYAVNGVDKRIYPEGMAGTPPQYAAAKAALLGLTRSLAAAWGSKNVRVNAVVAGGVRSTARQNEDFVANYSRKTMLGRMAQPDEIASAVAFLASDDASYITGECLMVDGGFSAW